IDRLEKIVNDPERPVQFLFSGKAHPADGAGQGLIKKIFEISQRPEFLGKIIFLENYDMQLARRLVSGVDIWMNTPTRPLEASGTSGEKAEMNGVVNLSVLDGWWLEGYRKGAGWALTEKSTYQNQGYQDQLDAATIYGLLENEIIPLYYNRNKKGYSEDWIKVVKNSIAQIAPHYTMKRQLDDYYEKFYNKEVARFNSISTNDNHMAKELALWKEAVAERWDAIKVVSSENKLNAIGVETGVECKIRYVIDEQGLDDAIGLELVSLKSDENGEYHIFKIIPMNMVRRDGNNYIFECNFVPNDAGSFKFSVRMFPKNNLLPHRQDFSYVKWIE
ncbi:MAG: alpha-glucan family phosphorylase, partial [Bacteroidaceae bacterium]|nr:alpha-glucan family phosphorylase [Bacteroidaceae bacterium]